MRRARIAVGVVAAFALAAGGAYWLRQPPSPARSAWQGYVEGNLVFMAPEESGRLERLMADVGGAVEAGELLFTLESSMQEAQKNEAEAKLRQAMSTVEDLKAAQQRPEQIAVLKAQEERARANLDLSRGDVARQRELYQRGIAAKARLESAEASHDRDAAALDEASRQIIAARLASRTAEIAASEAAARAAEATLRQAETRLARRRVAAPTAARVQDVYFRPGEVVDAGEPVLSLLPPTNLRLRFYVPEPQLSALTLGRTLAIACDNCRDGIAARVTFISRQAEFTPPVIFSEEERSKLVFRIEATPVGDMSLPIGLPIQVRLAEGAGS